MAITPEMWALWKEVKLNHKRLIECAGPHEFVGDENEVRATNKDGEKLYRYYVCTKCLGKVVSHDMLWYKRGLEHGIGKVTK